MLKLQGLASFVAAAKHMTKVTTFCESQVQAAQAGFLLGQCDSIAVLSLHGSCIPAVLPSTVTELTASFYAPGHCEGKATQPDAFIYHAALLPRLNKLSLVLANDYSKRPHPLHFPVQLRSLQSLKIRKIFLSSPHLDFSWVHRQPTDNLKLELFVDTSDVAIHDSIVQQLSQLALNALRLVVLVPFTSELQAIWSSLKVDKLTLESLDNASDTLHMLPHCSEMVWRYYPPVSSPAYISWQALISHPARIYLEVEGELHVVGTEGSAPDHLGQPWQLQVVCESALHGLPTSQPTLEGQYLLQNAAARAAGWTVQDL